jgi:L-ascorbate metabolism protein UlaG (beta-lactamase superfamily)
MFGDMALIDEIHQPKIGMVPVGDRFTMGGHGAAFALKRFFHFDAVFPCHYGTFDLLAPDASSLVAAMAGAKMRVIVPKIGESVEV